MTKPRKQNRRRKAAVVAPSQSGYVLARSFWWGFVATASALLLLAWALFHLAGCASSTIKAAENKGSVRTDSAEPQWSDEWTIGGSDENDCRGPDRPGAGPGRCPVGAPAKDRRSPLD